MTKPLTELYQKWGVYRRIDGMQTPNLVARDIRRALEKEILWVSSVKKRSA